jgi:uncharacterized tellurite resistance protein B-like protein
MSTSTTRHTGAKGFGRFGCGRLTRSEVDVVSFFSKLFGQKDDAVTQASSDTETVRRITRELDLLDVDEARYLAAFAFVLARVANSDMEISEDENRRMEEVVRDIGGLTEAQAVLVVQIAKSQQLLKGGTENYLVTREFNRVSDREQKERLLHCLFEVSSADESISLVEESEVRKIATELKFDHREFSAIRSQYNAKRSILR